MFNIGIDFGSTYTTVSAYRNETEKLETVVLGLGTPYIPTIAGGKVGSLDGLRYGSAAKGIMGRKDHVLYKAFKMLLTEKKTELLRERGYTEEITPAVVAEKFLTDLIQRVLEHYGEKEIDHVVIGAPEIWFKGVDSLSGRSILRNIFEKMDCVKEVQVVSEPAAASAFFAYNYQTLRNEAYDGHILLIDYGGGTLDITLSKVSAGTDSNGKQFMEINVADRQGAGENENGRIGKAGIIYMESLLEEAIRKAGLLEEDEPLETDGKFYKALNELEEEIVNRTTDINSTFEDIGLDYLDELEEEEFTVISYKGDDVEISYGLLVEVYNREIRPVLEENLKKSIVYMEEKKIPYADPLYEHLKIVLVGGFGNFYLVRKQVQDFFHFCTQDRRQADVIINKSDCENAISLGTALLSSGIVGIRHTAPYSVGILQRNFDGVKYRIDYAIRYREDLENGKLYYHSKANGEPIPIRLSGNSIRNLVINQEKDDSTAVVLPLQEEFQKRLTGVVKNKHNTAAIAFSMDQSDVLTIHIGEYNMLTREVSEMVPFELASFDELFDTAQVIRVIDLE